MHTTGHLELSQKAIETRSYLKGRMERKDLARFKSMTRFCATPIHIPEKSDREPAVHIAPAQGHPLPSAKFGPAFKALVWMFRAAHPQSYDEAILAACSAGFLGPDLSLLVSSMSRAEKEVLSSSPLATATKAGAFPLSLFTLIDGTTSIGREAVLGISVPHLPLSALSESGDVWAKLALKGVAEPSRMRLEYAGLAVNGEPGDTGMMTIIGIARGPLRMEERASYERTDIGFEKEAVAAAVHSCKGIISHEMQLALSVIGYREWGPDFLRLADK